MFGRKKQDDVREIMRVWDEKLAKTIAEFQLPEERFRTMWRAGRWYAERATANSKQPFAGWETEPVVEVVWVDIGPHTLSGYSFGGVPNGFATADEAHDWVRKTAAAEVIYYDKSASIIRTERQQ